MRRLACDRECDRSAVVDHLTAVLIGIWFVTLLGSWNIPERCRERWTAAAALPVALWGLGTLGVLWASVPWADRFASRVGTRAHDHRRIPAARRRDYRIRCVRCGPTAALALSPQELVEQLTERIDQAASDKEHDDPEYMVHLLLEVGYGLRSLPRLPQDGFQEENNRNRSQNYTNQLKHETPCCRS
jgi:hypothetical protein